jgi:hypothetical protein
MDLKSTATNSPKVLVARRYLERGFLDAAMRLFLANASLVDKRDWAALAARLMERQRIMDAVRVCEVGNVPMPREQLLSLGDGHLRRRDFEGAIRFYELGEADRQRWGQVIDLLTARPDQQLRAIELAERHLVDDEPVAVPLHATLH